MALTQISTQGIKDGTITGTDLATNIDLVDNQNIRLGTGNDMSLYHDGTNSIIANITGPLALQSNDLQLTDVTNSHPYIKCVRDAQVELYFNNSKKLRTKTAGIEIEGDLGMADNHKIKLGTGEDLQIYHDGSNSYIKQVSSGTGNLLIFADGHEIQLIPKSGEAGIKVINDGSVELFENGVKKAETTTDGFNVEGTLHANEIDMDDNHKIKLGLGDDLQIYHDGSQNIINGATGQNLEIQTNAFRVRNQADSESMIVANADSAVELYHDGSLKFETTSGGSKVTGNFIVNSGHISIDVDNKKLLLGANDDIQIYHDGTNDRIESSGSFLILEASNHIFRNTAGNEDYAKFLGNGAVELYHNGSKKFETVSGGAKVTGTLETTDTISTVGNLDMSDSTSTGNNRIRLGTGDDLEIFHDGSDSYISNVGTGELIIQPTSNEIAAVFRTNGSVELFHDNSKKFETNSAGITVIGSENGDGEINLQADEGDDNADKWRISAGANGVFTLKNFASGSAETNISAVGNGTVELYHNNSKKFETTSTGVTVTSSADPILTVTGPGHAKLNLTSTSGTDHCGVNFGDSSDENAGMIQYTNSNNLMVFHTNGVQRMAIQSDATVFFRGSHNNTANTEFEFLASTTSPFARFNHTANNAGHTFIQFRSNASQVGEIKDDGDGTCTYDTTSDYRLKENIVNIIDGIERVKKLIPRRFNFKVAPGYTKDGFLAHELQEVVPEAVHGTKDELVTEENKASFPTLSDKKVGDPVYQTADISRVVPLLAAGLKEAIAKIEVLETEVASLKAS